MASVASRVSRASSSGRSAREDARIMHEGYVEHFSTSGQVSQSIESNRVVLRRFLERFAFKSCDVSTRREYTTRSGIVCGLIVLVS
jgi:hypothetical protein